MNSSRFCGRIRDARGSTICLEYTPAARTCEAPFARETRYTERDESVFTEDRGTSRKTFSVSLTIGFGIGVTVNFLLQYFVVYAGTPQRFLTGYGFFVTLAIVNLFIMVHGAWFLYETMGVPFLAARLAIGSVTGSINFLLNTFFNFKLL